jgi:hypothetical protein
MMNIPACNHAWPSTGRAVAAGFCRKQIPLPTSIAMPGLKKTAEARQIQSACFGTSRLSP